MLTVDCAFVLVECMPDKVTLSCLSDSGGSEKGEELPGVCGGFCSGAQKPCWYVGTPIYCMSLKVPQTHLMFITISVSLCSQAK